MALSNPLLWKKMMPFPAQIHVMFSSRIHAPLDLRGTKRDHTEFVVYNFPRITVWNGDY